MVVIQVSAKKGHWKLDHLTSKAICSWSKGWFHVDSKKNQGTKVIRGVTVGTSGCSRDLEVHMEPLKKSVRCINESSEKRMVCPRQIGVRMERLGVPGQTRKT